ncbi:MAG: RICIN domain-containing protein, partial [Leptospirales bacterium]
MLVIFGFLGTVLAACQEQIENSEALELSALSGLTALQTSGANTTRLNGASYFHAEVHPPYWLEWTTDGARFIENKGRFLTQGLRCSGRYCDNVNLLSTETAYSQTQSWWTDYFSEEGDNARICANQAFVTGIQCTGRYCDNISLRCSQLNNNAVRTACYWTAPVSEESGGKFIAPESMYVAGMRCSGRYCDNKELYLCQADAGAPAMDVPALARQFAPRLRFDQGFGGGSGDQNKCFPGDPATYYAERAQGARPQDLCNKDYSTIQNNQVPIYYLASRVGTNAVLIRYWYFYAWQSTCFAGAGSHAADWESVAALIVNGELQRVAFYQHGGWYTKERGNFELANGTHPVAYVGKNSHGSYHDDGGSGGCLYFEDFRNPGGNDYRMDTWNNLHPLERGTGAPAWMNCTGSGCFDGIGHPIEQTGSLPAMAGCGKDGCGKASLGGARPFLSDPTGTDFVKIVAKHSGRALEVAGAGGGDGANVQQYDDFGGYHQRWSLQSTGDGHFRISAR